MVVLGLRSRLEGMAECNEEHRTFIHHTSVCRLLLNLLKTDERPCICMQSLISMALGL